MPPKRRSIPARPAPNGCRVRAAATNTRAHDTASAASTTVRLSRMAKAARAIASVWALASRKSSGSLPAGARTCTDESSPKVNASLAAK
ncbi:MAG: hypothetical protein ACOZIN_13370 [Myxococcota bacterium]